MIYKPACHLIKYGCVPQSCCIAFLWETIIPTFIISFVILVDLQNRRSFQAPGIYVKQCGIIYHTVTYHTAPYHTLKTPCYHKPSNQFTYPSNLDHNTQNHTTPYRSTPHPNPSHHNAPLTYNAIPQHTITYPHLKTEHHTIHAIRYHSTPHHNIP